jgi:hypothetical protein
MNIGLRAIAAVFALACLSLGTAGAENSATALPAAGPQLAPRATVVSSFPYREYIHHSCTSDGNCFFTFTPVPANRRLEIGNVSCYLETQLGTIVRSFQLHVLRPNLAIATAVTLLPTFVDADELGKYWALNHQIDAFATAGQRFQIFVEPGSQDQFVTFVACHISGDMLVLEP